MQNAMVMGADYYESTETRKSMRDQGKPPIGEPRSLVYMDGTIVVGLHPNATVSLLGRDLTQ